MFHTFISYASENTAYASQLYKILKSYNINTFYAPAYIGLGEDFAEVISAALSAGDDMNDQAQASYEETEDALLDARMKNISETGSLILVLSRFSMASSWCKKELKIAIKKNMPVFVLGIDSSTPYGEWEYMLVDCQYMEAKHLTEAVVKELLSRMSKELKIKPFQNIPEFKSELISCASIAMKRISKGDPYFTEGETLNCTLSPLEYYLAPPEEMIDDNNRRWARKHFAAEDKVLDLSLSRFEDLSGLCDLTERIDRARHKVFNDFIRHENGCYYNNKKFGINNLNPFKRSEDLSEVAMTEIELYTTDYYTHRVMKEVCKELYNERPSFISSLNFVSVYPFRIFLTSLGINLLLLDADRRIGQNTLIAVRSKNSTESAGSERFALSVIEGVSLTDYEDYYKKVNLTDALERGLFEELGVPKDKPYLDKNSIRFYDIFINLANLETGISCSAELYPDHSLKEVVEELEGKDGMLEVAEKLIIPVDELADFVKKNKDRFMTQAIYSVGSFLGSINIPLLDYTLNTVYKNERFICGKDPDQSLCEDIIFENEYFTAVIDGSTSKSEKLYDGKPGGLYAARLAKEALGALSSDISAKEAVSMINNALRAGYKDVPYEECKPADRFGVSVVIFSHKKKEIWSFGDSQLCINEKVITHTKKIDTLLADMRAFICENMLLSGADTSQFLKNDPGRKEILPYLKDQLKFANTDSAFGYDVLDGGDIDPGHVKIYYAESGDHIVLASDGYPRLFPSLEESEAYLKNVLEADPLCIGANRQTKGLLKGNLSYDDRAYISFTV